LKLIITSSTPAELTVTEATESDLSTLRSLLTFRDRQVEFLVSKHKRNRRWRDSATETWKSKLDDLTGQITRCLLLSDDSGRWYTYVGLASYIQQAMPGTVVENQVQYPVPAPVAWEHVPKYSPRYYQSEAKAALWVTRHGAISMPTGSGKSYIISELCRDLGVRAVIMAPTTSIARQLYCDFLSLFGKKNVGLYGDGKKEIGKRFTIGIAASLTRVEIGSEAWNFFSNSDLVICDESHLLPATTFEHVCMGLLRTAPYRFFVSATQMRTDGAELLLRGIVGDIVYRKEFQELVDEEFLAKPHFVMARIPSTHPYHGDDALKMSQHHLLYNKRIIEHAGRLINGMAKQGKRVLVLIDEIAQFAALLPQLRVQVGFAHGGCTAVNRDSVPGEYRKSDPQALVRAFDAGELPVLVGTSCIGIGTDIRSPEVVVFLQGGMSEIQVTQALGRGTRRGYVYPDGHTKSDFLFVDYAPVVQNGHYQDGVGKMSSVYRHALARSKIYEQIYPNSLKWVQYD